MITSLRYPSLLFLTLFVHFSFSVHALPLVIAHRGGGQNYPENTLLSFSKSLEMGCDALELDVQVTKDGVVAVYHPNDLKQWTNGSGSISSHNWEEIADLDAGYQFKPAEGYPYRGQNVKIPTLTQVLKIFPRSLIIIDMKSMPAESLVKALIHTISDEETERLIFYSTNSQHIELLHQMKPHWKTFETRDKTRQRLFDLNQTGGSEVPLTDNWIGFELKRKMSVTEEFALGQGTSTVEFHLWNPQVVALLRERNPRVSLVLFGINKKQDWEMALHLDVNAIYTDNPKEINALKVQGNSHL